MREPTTSSLRPPPAHRNPAARAAATVAVVRDGTDGLEVLLLRRADRGDHFSGAWVFPGGALDATDRALHAWCDGLDDAQASARMRLPQGGLDYWVAAIRECFEEAGVLFAADAAGHAPRPAPAGQARWDELRRRLHRGDCGMADVCREFGVRLAPAQLAYVAHWVTPPGTPKRFDTRFFIAALPPGQAPAHDAVELLEHLWLTPAAGLASQGARRMMAVTQHLLETMARFPTVAALMDWAHERKEVEMIMRRRARDENGPTTVSPGAPAYDEIALVDPQGEGTAWCVMRPGEPVRLTRRVQRITSPDGCNSYLVDAGGGASIVIDAGRQADPAHLQALRAAAGRIDTILATGPNDRLQGGAQALAQATGARVVEAEPGDRFDVGDGHLSAIAAPDGGIEWLLEEEGILFTSEHEGSGDAFPDGIAWIAPRRGFLFAAHEVPAGAPESR